MCGTPAIQLDDLGGISPSTFAPSTGSVYLTGPIVFRRFSDSPIRRGVETAAW